MSPAQGSNRPPAMSGLAQWSSTIDKSGWRAAKCVTSGSLVRDSAGGSRAPARSSHQRQQRSKRASSIQADRAVVVGADRPDALQPAGQRRGGDLLRERRRQRIDPADDAGDPGKARRQADREERLGERPRGLDDDDPVDPGGVEQRRADPPVRGRGRSASSPAVRARLSPRARRQRWTWASTALIGAPPISAAAPAMIIASTWSWSTAARRHDADHAAVLHHRQAVGEIEDVVDVVADRG